MLINGFHNKVDIYFLNDGAETRTTKHNKFLSKTPDLKNVPCRIIKDIKVMFEPHIKLMPGYVIKEINTDMTYKVIKGNSITGLIKPHHSSYLIEIKGESDRIAGQHTNRS